MEIVKVFDLWEFILEEGFYRELLLDDLHPVFGISSQDDVHVLGIWLQVVSRQQQEQNVRSDTPTDT